MGSSNRRRETAERELYRLTLAKFDFRTAATVAEHLSSGAGDLHAVLAGGSTDLYWGMWTALAVSYARPFTKCKVGRLSARRFEQFDNELQARDHRFLLGARKILFAHNDLTQIRAVTVFPPGAWGESPGSAEVERASFIEAAAKRSLHLCQLQRERAREQIADIVQELYGDQDWEEGTILSLEYPTLDQKPQGLSGNKNVGRNQ